MSKRKATIISKDCVACGCCIKVCPKKAISIPKGVYAEVNDTLCVGCGICAKECPASTIVMEVYDEKK